MSTALFVEQLYNRFLYRDSEPAGRDSWIESIDNGTISAVDASVAFVQSPEFQSAVADICTLYYGLFNRIPDNSGLAAWVGVMRNGLSLNDAAEGFINSAEFENRYGSNLTNEAFIQALSQNVLGHQQDSAGLASWQQQLDASNRAALVTAMVGSDEAAARLSDDVQTTTVYYGILDRAPTAQELSTAPGSLADQVASLYQSSEYQGVAVPGLADSTPQALFSNGHYDTATHVLTLYGSDLDQLLAAGESASTDIQARFEWGALNWETSRYVYEDGDGQDAFSAADIQSARVLDSQRLEIRLTDSAAQALESRAYFGHSQDDTMRVDRLRIDASFAENSSNAGNIEGMVLGIDGQFYSHSGAQLIIGTDGVDSFHFQGPFNVGHIDWQAAQHDGVADVSQVEVVAVSTGDRLDFSRSSDDVSYDDLDGFVNVPATDNLAPGHTVLPTVGQRNGQVAVYQGDYDASRQQFSHNASGDDLMIAIAINEEPLMDDIIVLTGTHTISSVEDGVITV